MPVQMTIIGLGQIGASIGLALARHKNIVSVVGHDKDYALERAAQKKGAVATAEHNLPNAIKNARIVVLAIPVHQIRETLEFIAPDLLDGTVVVDTAPIKSQVAKWAKDFLPEGCHYVGIIPTPGPDFLSDIGTGLDSAQVGLFSKSLFLVSAPPGTPVEAVQLVSDLVKLLDATALLTDIVESDGLMTSAHLLPQLVSAALLNATLDQPGWQDIRKLADRPYIAATSGLTDPISLQMLSLHNRENTLRSLDTMISALQTLREDIEDGKEELIKNHLQSASTGRENWLNERAEANWVERKHEPANYPSLSDRLLGGILGKRAKNK